MVRGFARPARPLGERRPTSAPCTRSAPWAAKAQARPGARRGPQPSRASRRGASTRRSRFWDSISPAIPPPIPPAGTGSRGPLGAPCRRPRPSGTEAFRWSSPPYMHSRRRSSSLSRRNLVSGRAIDASWPTLFSSISRYSWRASVRRSAPWFKPKRTNGSGARGAVGCRVSFLGYRSGVAFLGHRPRPNRPHRDGPCQPDRKARHMQTHFRPAAILQRHLVSAPTTDTIVNTFYSTGIFN